MAEIAIVGAGECGVRAAFTLRELGFQGSVTLLTAEKALPYERPPLSKTMLANPKAIRAEDAYPGAGIELRRGALVESLVPERREIHLADGTLLTYDQLLLATGARARLFPGLEGCLTLRTDVQARRIMLEFSSNARIGVIGGGFIGLELAATARQAGAEVTVIETAPRILGRAVPGAIAQIVHARHETAGVKILTGTVVTEAGTNRIVLANGIELEFDAVIAGVGAIPNTELAEKAGLFVDNGIVVDSAFRTSEPNIFAAGDCCNFEWRGARMRLESWKAAQDQGAHAAAAMLGASGEYQKVPWFWSDQFDLTLQVAGQFDLTRDIHHRAASGGVRIVFQCDQDARVSAAAAIGQGNTIARDMSVLEKLIERGTVVAASSLIDPDFRIKGLLK